MVETTSINKNIRARAGHTMNVHDYHLYIIGGSHSQDYFKDIVMIDVGKKDFRLMN